MPIQKRTSPLKFDGLAAKSEKDTVSYLSTKVKRGRAKIIGKNIIGVESAYHHHIERVKHTLLEEDTLKDMIGIYDSI